jgi:predicted transcriptional regulator
MESTPLHNFHLPLADDLYLSLRETAKRLSRPATELVREALARWLEEEKRDALHRAISEYAAAHAGTPADLDEGMEKASIEHLSQVKGKQT